MSNTSNRDQQLVDYLYNAIFVQKTRCNHFNAVGPQAVNSVWNRHSDENKILNDMVENYKQYYIDKVEELKITLNKIKEDNVNSYLTYDPEYHINKYTERMEELDKYLVELENKTIDHISKEKLSFVSEEINSQFPDYMSDPTLLGLLC